MESYEDEGADSPAKTSKYNAAVDQLYRLGELFRNASTHARSGNYIAWNYDLDVIWRELAQDITDKDQENKFIDIYNIRLIKIYPLKSGEASGFNKRDREQDIRFGMQYLILAQKELYLRRLQNRLGKGTKWEDDDDDYMDG